MPSENKNYDLNAQARERMVQSQLIARGITDPRVLAAMRKVPRHLFVEDALEGQAYGDFPVPIGEQQTISQPYMVALMSEALSLKGPEKVLEIGTGSGYQAAILAELVEQVFSIERFSSLAFRARRLLEELRYFNVRIRVGDGTLGWPEESPFDCIIVTAGAPSVPKPLMDQVKIGGKIIIPVGDQYSQTLSLGIKTPEKIQWDYYGGCRFVKLVGSYGWS